MAASPGGATSPVSTLLTTASRIHAAAVVPRQPAGHGLQHDVRDAVAVAVVDATGVSANRSAPWRTGSGSRRGHSLRVNLLREAEALDLPGQPLLQRAVAVDLQAEGLAGGPWLVGTRSAGRR